MSTALLIIFLTAANTVTAEEWQVKPFSAEFISSYSGDPPVVDRGRVYVDKKGVRIETVEDGEPTVFIYSFLKGASWVLIPEKKLFMQFGEKEGAEGEEDVPAGPQDIIATIPCEEYEVSKRLGYETLRGRVAEKWICRNPDKSWAYEWFDKRLKVLVKEESSSGSVFELHDVKEGPQPLTLFTVPRDYLKIDPGGLFD